VSPSASASISPTAASASAAPTTLPVTGGSTAPVALVGGGLLLSGLGLLGVRLFLARRT
jgi:LPXTG-motif cell wall-anchored protein